MNVRVAAAQVISAILRHEGSLATQLPQVLDKVPEADRALLQQLCYGTLRHYPKLACYLTLLLSKPFKKKDLDIQAALVCGLYQLLDSRIPPHAAVNETVACCIKLKKPWAKGVINGVLRRFQREQQSLDEQLREQPQQLTPFNSSHPQWMIDTVCGAWPEQAEATLAANNHQPPMTLRVNQCHNDRNAYLQQLEQAGLPSHITPISTSGITLNTACDVTQLPGFSEGHISVQDEAAQLAVQILNPQKGDRLLDACCAPGGKTGHLLEWTRGECQLTAIDNAAHRMARVTDNLQRLNFSATLITAAAEDTDSWWDGEPFDRILLDAPCSASGVIRRHPDIKILRKMDDLLTLPALQSQLLRALWPLLKPGGQLLYATCSIFPAENDDVIQQFLAGMTDATPIPIPLQAGIQTATGLQLLPQIGGNDGFYFALLQKNATE